MSDGLFTVALDFGDVFDGTPLWLRVSVRPAGVGNYTVLSPRQALTPAPYAIYAAQVGAHGHWGEEWSGSGTGLTLSGGSVGVSATGTSYGVYAGSPEGHGVYAEATAATGSTYGVYGLSASTSGRGVYGRANAGSGSTYGVYGLSQSAEGIGVYGRASRTTGTTYGVMGESASTTGRGVWGWATATTGETRGVFGRSRSDEGMGVFGYADSDTGTTYGVHGRSDSETGRGVWGWATATTGYTRGVFGRVRSDQGRGVYGYADSQTGLTYGVYGRSESNWGLGVFGLASDTTGTGETYGVMGQSRSPTGVGVSGFATASTGKNYGVMGITSSDDGYAGFFVGDVEVQGNLTKSGGWFKIDHPLDPENKYLYHSFVESPDMKNIYDGVVTLDARGEAVVELPEWFEALNRDFRYQLTPIGASMPGLYIAQEVQDNQFAIGGGVAGARVSWLVTGIRHDPWAEQNRIPIEQDKPTDEQGTYLYPEGYGQPQEMGLDYQRDAHLFDEALEAIEPPLAGSGE